MSSLMKQRCAKLVIRAASHCSGGDYEARPQGACHKTNWPIRRKLKNVDFQLVRDVCQTWGRAPRHPHQARDVRRLARQCPSRAAEERDEDRGQRMTMERARPI